MAVCGEIGCGWVEVWHKIRLWRESKVGIDCAQ